MRPWPQTPWTDILLLNHFERDVTASAREVRDVGFSDTAELRLKLNGIVAACSELLSIAERKDMARLDRLMEEAREERATSIPPVETSTC